jgi:hypothetical protein
MRLSTRLLLAIMLLLIVCPPAAMHAQSGDRDEDGIADRLECPAAPCRDTDADGVPDVEDADDDGDGILTRDERLAVDEDDDGIPAYLDRGEAAGPVGAQDVEKGGGDSDGDGVPDRFECPAGVPCPDSDGDGVPDYFDPHVPQVCGPDTLSYFDGELSGSAPAAGDELWYQLPLLPGDVVTVTLNAEVDSQVVVYAPYVDPETGLTGKSATSDV